MYSFFFLPLWYPALSKPTSCDRSTQFYWKVYSLRKASGSGTQNVIRDYSLSVPLGWVPRSYQNVMERTFFLPRTGGFKGKPLTTFVVYLCLRSLSSEWHLMSIACNYWFSQPQLHQSYLGLGMEIVRMDFSMLKRVVTHLLERSTHKTAVYRPENNFPRQWLKAF